MELTKESLTAISTRYEKERMARQSAENRFSAEQYLTHNRKQRNRGLLIAAILITGSVLIGHDFVSRVMANPGANPGKIIAQSELPKVDQPKAEKRHANAR